MSFLGQTRGLDLIYGGASFKSMCLIYMGTAVRPEMVGNEHVLPEPVVYLWHGLLDHPGDEIDSVHLHICNRSSKEARDEEVPCPIAASSGPDQAI